MANTVPQYFPNDLLSVEASTSELQNASEKLRVAMSRALDMMTLSLNAHADRVEELGTIFTGDIGKHRISFN